MNAIQTANQINFYNNLTRNARFTSTEIDMAVNSAMIEFIDEKLGDRTMRSPENFQLMQAIRSDLSTLITTVSPTVTPATAVTNRYYTITPMTFPTPTDYYDFVALVTLIDGYTSYARPTTYNERGPLFEDSFKHPTNTKVYFNDTAAGMVLYRGTGGTFTSATLDYIKYPTAFTVGPDANIVPAGSTLTNGLSYIATEITNYNSTIYQIGATITGVGVATMIITGAVILTSYTNPIILPPKVHDEICRMASVILLKSVGEYPESQAIESIRSKV